MSIPWSWSNNEEDTDLQVITWSCQPLGDGINWPVVEGADQYTLTRWHLGLGWTSYRELDFFSREQLRQKEDKRGRTREYQIVNHYSGKWLPLSQASVLVDFMNLEILVNCHISCLWLTTLETFFTWSLSQGCGVCTHPPCTDEPRIPLQVMTSRQHQVTLKTLCLQCW